MKKILILYLSLILLASCKKEQKPEGVLSEDQLVSMLIDIHLAEGYVSVLPIHYDSSRVLYPLFEKEVFEKHQVPDSVFKSSLEYYMRDARVMEKIYSRVIDSLHVVEKVGNQ